MDPLRERLRTSLVVQWWRIHMSMQETQVRSLIQEDLTCRGAAQPMHHHYWAHTLEPWLCNRRSNHNEKPMHCNEDPLQPKLQRQKKERERDSTFADLPSTQSNQCDQMIRGLKLNSLTCIAYTSRQRGRMDSPPMWSELEGRAPKGKDRCCYLGWANIPLLPGPRRESTDNCKMQQRVGQKIQHMGNNTSHSFFFHLTFLGISWASGIIWTLIVREKSTCTPLSKGKKHTVPWLQPRMGSARGVTVLKWCGDHK